MSSSNGRIMPKLGIIIPSSNTTMETEFNLLARDKFTVHAARIKLKKVALEDLKKMERGAEEAAALLADANADVIAYGCTSGSLFRGLGHDIELTNIIRERTRIPAVATSRCVVEALKLLKVRKLSIATPYTDNMNELEKRFLVANGFEVTRIKGLGIEDNLEIGATQSQRIIHLAKEADTEDAQALFISCTNLPSMNVIVRLEEVHGKPVVSSNTATLWSMLKTLKRDYSWVNLGKLFSIVQA